MDIATIGHPCDKKLFPSFDSSLDVWRESTTFFSDFKIAERFGIRAIKDTFNRAFESWKDNAKYLCELTIVTNHLCWEAYARNNNDLSKLYHDFYYKCYGRIFAADDNGNNAGPFSDEECVMIYKILD